MTLKTTKTKLLLDGRWNLEELSEATRDYTQLYGFAYSLVPDLPLARLNEIDYIYGKFPWKGGYSTVNFFNQLFHKIPPKLRPEVERIQYASPGFIELSEILLVALTVAGIVKAVCSSINMAHDTYRKIQKGSVDFELSKINLSKEKLDLTQKQRAFCESSSNELVKIFDLSVEQDKLLNQRVQSNPAIKLKILLSVFRRVEPLAKKQSEGKIKILGEASEQI